MQLLAVKYFRKEALIVSVNDNDNQQNKLLVSC